MNARPYEIYRVVTDMEALHEAFRDRVEDLNVSRLELDAMAELTPGYASKLLCDPPMKFVGRETLPKMLRGTGLAIALVVDDGKSGEIEQRKYPKDRVRAARDAKRLKLPAPEGVSIKPNLEKLSELLAQMTREERIKMGASNGGKRRAKAMKKRARQRQASHAARMRWSKRASP